MENLLSYRNENHDVHRFNCYSLWPVGGLYQLHLTARLLAVVFSFHLDKVGLCAKVRAQKNITQAHRSLMNTHAKPGFKKKILYC